MTAPSDRLSELEAQLAEMKSTVTDPTERKRQGRRIRGQIRDLKRRTGDLSPRSISAAAETDSDGEQVTRRSRRKKSKRAIREKAGSYTSEERSELADRLIEIMALPEQSNPPAYSGYSMTLALDVLQDEMITPEKVAEIILEKFNTSWGYPAEWYTRWEKDWEIVLGLGPVQTVDHRSSGRP